MSVPRPSEREILQRIYNRLVNETGITANLDSSTIGMILKMIAAEMNLVWQYVEELYNQSNLSTATGASLDNFGLLLGAPRRQSRNSSTLGYTRAVRFTNLGVAPVSVPSGTRVFKEKDPQIAYFTVEGAIIPAGQSVDLHVTAAEQGEIYNVTIGELNAHSVPNVSLSVTNILPIQNGSQVESDGSYRERLLQEMRRREVINKDNCVALLRSVPGVKDVYMIEYYRGAGTFDAIIIPYNESATTQIVAEAQRLLDEYVPVGISAVAKGPKYRMLDINIVIRFDPSAGDKREGVRESIRAQIRARIDNLPIENGSGNGTFYTNQIRALATLAGTEVLDAIVSLGLDGSPMSPEGEIRLGIGERLALRSLSVQ